MRKSFSYLGMRFAEMGRGIGTAASRVLEECVREAMEDARETAPVGMGIRREPRLVDSFSYEVNGLKGEMWVRNPHAAYVEFGTGVRGAQSTGTAPGGKYDADWLGMAAQPYMYPAAQRARGDFAQRMMTAVIEAATGRGGEE